MAGNSILHCCSPNIRRQAKMLYVWYPEHQKDWDTIHEENDVTETRQELANVKKQLKQSKHICLAIKTEYPRDCEITG